MVYRIASPCSTPSPLFAARGRPAAAGPLLPGPFRRRRRPTVSAASPPPRLRPNRRLRFQGELLLLAGDLLAQSGDFGAALAKFQRAAAACAPPPPAPAPTALPAGCPLPWVSAGRAYLQMNERARAERHLVRAVAMDPSCAAAHLDLGQLRLQSGDLPAALAHFAGAMRASRSFPELHDALACRLVATAHQAALDDLARVRA